MALSLLIPSTCAHYEIPHKPSGRILSGIAGKKAVDFAQGNTLHLPGLAVSDLDFYINDYNLLSSVYGVKIDGIIGYSFFSRYVVAINYDSLFIEVYSPGEITYPRGGFFLKPFYSTIPIQDLRVKDDRTVIADFYIDSGAGLNLLMTSEFVKDSAILHRRRKPVTIQAEGLGGKKQMRMTIVKEVKLGPYHFRRVPVHIFDDDFNAISYPSLGGLVGNDLLRRFNQVINYGKRQIYLIPNEHFKDDFDYSYTGLSFYSVNGKIVIDDVVKDSPAGRAGFMANDVILAVNNDFSGDIQHYKNILQHQGKAVTIFLMRDSIPKIIDFKVGRIN